MPHRTCARCQELSDLIGDLLTPAGYLGYSAFVTAMVEGRAMGEVEVSEQENRAAKAVLALQRHIKGVNEATEQIVTALTGMERNGRDT